MTAPEIRARATLPQILWALACTIRTSRKRSERMRGESWPLTSGNEKGRPFQGSPRFWKFSPQFPTRGPKASPNECAFQPANRRRNVTKSGCRADRLPECRLKSLRPPQSAQSAGTEREPRSSARSGCLDKPRYAQRARCWGEHDSPDLLFTTQAENPTYRTRSTQWQPVADLVPSTFSVLCVFSTRGHHGTCLKLGSSGS